MYSDCRGTQTHDVAPLLPPVPTTAQISQEGCVTLEAQLLFWCRQNLVSLHPASPKQKQRCFVEDQTMTFSHIFLSNPSNLPDELANGINESVIKFITLFLTEC